MYKKSKAQTISDAVCGILMLASIMAYILIGIFAHSWHPTWVIIVCSAIVCGIVSIAVNTYTSLHREEENKTTDEKKSK